MNQKPIRVLMVDDHQLIIEGLKSILQEEPDIEFCGGANSMKEALAFVAANDVDVILLDVNMPDGSGIETTKIFREKFPEVRILALTMHEDISIITQMVKAGASGYLLKGSNMKEIIEAIKAVYSNNRYLSKEVQSILMDNLGNENGNDKTQSGPKAIITSREREILNLIAKEMTNAEIADKLFISERTVETHRRNIITKTKAKSVVALINYAMKHGLLEGEEATS
jgi:DNA-binding NarL/FixJ family response regulator